MLCALQNCALDAAYPPFLPPCQSITPAAPNSNPNPAEFPDALPIGTWLGDFTVTKVIGLGGFGIVYMAQDTTLERTVATKEYLPITIAGRTSAQTVLVRSRHQLDTYSSGLQRFMREARSQARFSHPAMLEVYQVWEQNGTAYMAMRCYPGHSLRDLRYYAQGSQLFDEASLRYSPAFVAAVNDSLVVKPNERLQSIAAFREALGWGNDASQPPQAAFAMHEPVSSVEMDWPSSPTIDMPTQPRASRTTMISGARFALALVLGIAGYMKVQRQTGQAASVATPVVPASNEPSANRP